MQRLIAGLGNTPIAGFAADWTLLTWNRLWSSLIGDPLQVPAPQRNLVHAMFLDPTGDSRWPVRSEQNERDLLRAVVSDLRVAASTYPADRNLATLIDTARTRSSTFAQLWTTGTSATTSAIERP